MTFSTPLFEIEEHSIDALRPMKLIIVGAGISAITAMIRLRQKIENLTIHTYEKNSDVGGTWTENRYPGCACDIPSHSYQLSFEPNSQWSRYYAPAREIESYWQGVAKKYDLYRQTMFNHRVIEGRWDEKTGKWRVVVENTKTGQKITDEGDFLIVATGFLNNWRWPDIPGREDFKGHIVHSAAWDEDYDFTSKTVALIGAGSSALQILPEMQKIVKHLDNYVRSTTWISAFQFTAEFARKYNLADDFVFSSELKQKFLDDPKILWNFRKNLEIELNSIHPITQAANPMQKFARELFDKRMREKLVTKPEIADMLIPTFPVGCKRLTPGPGYLEALVQDNVEFVHQGIKRFLPDGIESLNGTIRKYDAIICATGFDCSFRPRFPFIGRNNVDLRDKYEDRPDSYLGVAVDDFPNMFMLGGPNTGVGSGSLTIVFEKVAMYIAKAVKKAQLERIKALVPSADAVKDYMEYLDHYFPRTVFGQECKSWYKNGKTLGRITGLWPGSCLHAVKTLENPRWEDYEYVLLDGKRNRFGYLGDGFTEVEKNGGDLAFYMDNLDPPAVPLLDKHTRQIAGVKSKSTSATNGDTEGISLIT